MPMKKKIELNKKSIKRLQLKLKPTNERKVAPATINSEFDDGSGEFTPTNGTGCDRTIPIWTCW
jgi:hypothetical protein